MAAAARYAIDRWVAEIETVLTRLLNGSPLAEVADANGLARAVSASFIGLELYDGVDRDGALVALDALQRLGVLVDVMDDLGPVAHRALRRRVRRKGADRAKCGPRERGAAPTRLARIGLTRSRGGLRLRGRNGGSVGRHRSKRKTGRVLWIAAGAIVVAVAAGAVVVTASQLSSGTVAMAATTPSTSSATTNCPRSVSVIVASSVRPVLDRVVDSFAGTANCVGVQATVADGSDAITLVEKTRPDVWIADDTSWGSLVPPGILTQRPADGHRHLAGVRGAAPRCVAARRRHHLGSGSARRSPSARRCG